MGIKLIKSIIQGDKIMIEKQESRNPEFITLDEAAEMTNGTRVTFVPGVQAMYSEALKNICFVKKSVVDQSAASAHGCRRDNRKEPASKAI